MVSRNKGDMLLRPNLRRGEEGSEWFTDLRPTKHLVLGNAFFVLLRCGQRNSHASNCTSALWAMACDSAG